jgi:hypothetical protein
MENQVDTDHYWTTSDVWVHNSLTQTWAVQVMP